MSFKTVLESVTIPKRLLAFGSSYYFLAVCWRGFE